ncbi:site-specific DNA-methyltransferase [Mycoplasma sp. CSL7503-lung]|uniref:site-specific DNA-methyltransferase n=1 Tax=Mycoplasma sp. CSL7503-lung TaxID=536372 RepID=UPI0021D23BA7|nr:site-specific DNA-methyltransferase [Mycoplasma sp. CSL7503-lung]MCU4706970.1 site-specific DNA-methyltransferase [Mycoplasma sp. CSL7503-lung]
MDPPYNTESAHTDGNNSANDKENVGASKFIYRDKFNRNGWLNMMNERLKLAKKLLKDDGVIFVSIDDNEQAYLKVLMDEIFGEENFVANVSRLTTPHRADQEKFLNTNHDYLLIFAKDKYNLKKFNKVIRKEIDNNKVEIDEFGRKYIVNDTSAILASVGQGYVTSLDYDIEIDGHIFKPILSNGERWRWLWSKPRFEAAIKHKILKYNKEKNSIRKINYLNYYFEEKTNEMVKSNKEFMIMNTTEFITNQDFKNLNGTKEVSEILLNFSFPKPVNLITQLLRLIPNKNARVLDFFAGSGTTGHAVMELNKEDGGNRTFTLVTNNENNIGYEVTYERLFRINNGIGTNNETFKWAEKNEPYKQNLNVFDLEYSNISVDQNQIKTEYLIDTLRNSLSEFDVKNITDEELLNNLSNLYSLEGDDSNGTN